jgi:endonuclease YncB( thermonuclease family)
VAHGVRMRNALLSTAAFVLGVTSATAFAWGPQGHQYAGAIADQLLTANAKSQVNTILGLELRVAATWADCVKDVGLAQVSAGLAWHYKAYQHEQTPEERTDYSRAENEARVSRLGLWAEPKPVPPSEWRRTRGN